MLWVYSSKIFLITILIASIWISHLHNNPVFSNIISTSGISATIPSSGASWSDFNNDEYTDVFISGSKNSLYKNIGNNKFEDVTKNAGINIKYRTISAVFGDYNNDGCADLFVVGNGINPNALYKNNCNGQFHEVPYTKDSRKEYHDTGASWADYNNDGYIDLYIASYGFPQSDKYTSHPNTLYKNNGDETFSDVTKKAKVSGYAEECDIQDIWSGSGRKLINGPYKQSYQPIWFDYNNDGLTDLMITNDGGVSPLYENNGDETFSDVTKKAGLCRISGAMGASIGDYNNDGFMDIYITNTGPNFLWKNNGNGTFIELAAELGIADYQEVGWGTEFLDYDNDGWLDLMVINGIVDNADYKTNKEWSKDAKKKDKLFKNDAGRKFIETKYSGVYGNDAKEGGSSADFNNDGYIDMIVLSKHDQASKNRLYKNNGNGNNWIKIKLVGINNMPSIGAKITIKGDFPNQFKQIVAGSSFMSQNDTIQHFGIGKSKTIKSIEVTWPNGKKQTVHDIKANQLIKIIEN